MIKRPLNPQFKQAVLDGRKFTTIREKPWPVGIPIMLYHWAENPYRSKHVNVAAVIVSGYWTIEIARTEDDRMRYSYGMETPLMLHQTEGFDSRKAMDDWFRQLVKPGEVITKTLMRFSLQNTKDIPPTGSASSTCPESSH